MTPRNQNDSTDEYWYCIQDKIFPISLSLLSFPSPVGKFYKTGWIFLYLMFFFKCNTTILDEAQYFEGVKGLKFPVHSTSSEYFIHFIVGTVYTENKSDTFITWLVTL